MRYATNFAVAIGAGIAMAFVAGCAPTTHVTETTTTREYDTKNPPVVVAPVASSSMNAQAESASRFMFQFSNFIVSPLK